MSDMDIGGLSSYYNTSASQTSGDKLSSQIAGKDFSTASADELMDACKKFEGYFIEQVYKAMEKTIPKNEAMKSSSGTSYEEMFKDTLIQEYANLTTESNGGTGLGLAQTLYEQMKRNYGIEE